MRIGAFEVHDRTPELNQPHALAMLRPWIDVGSVGSLVMTWLENHFSARDMAQFARPGEFFDFTRYRPTTFVEEGERRLSIPNTTVTYSRRENAQDFLFIRLLEPHNHSEDYVESVVELLKRYNVKRYCLLGSMYDYTPHTRPLLVTGTPSQGVRQDANRSHIRPSRYQGPTTITTLISQMAGPLGIETMTMIVHLPQYTQLDEDYMGAVRVMEALSPLYGIPVDGTYIAKADRQREQIDSTLSENAQLKGVIEQLEQHYDARQERQREQESPKMSPEIEKFLAEMDRKFREEQPPA